MISQTVQIRQINNNILSEIKEIIDFLHERKSTISKKSPMPRFVLTQSQLNQIDNTPPIDNGLIQHIRNNAAGSYRSSQLTAIGESHWQYYEEKSHAQNGHSLFPWYKLAIANFWHAPDSNRVLGHINANEISLLADAIKSNLLLREIEIHIQCLYQAEALALAELINNSPNLICFKLRSNLKVESSALSLLAEAIVRHENLQHLELRLPEDIAFTSEEISNGTYLTQLVQILEESKWLKSLQLEFNQKRPLPNSLRRDMLLQKLLEAARNSITLHKLKISANPCFSIEEFKSVDMTAENWQQCKAQINITIEDDPQLRESFFSRIKRSVQTTSVNAPLYSLNWSCNRWVDEHLALVNKVRSQRVDYFNFLYALFSHLVGFKLFYYYLSPSPAELRCDYALLRTLLADDSRCLTLKSSNLFSIMVVLGDEAAVNLLLDHGFNPLQYDFSADINSDRCRPPLYHAINLGYDRMAATLLAKTRTEDYFEINNWTFATPSKLVNKSCTIVNISEAYRLPLLKRQVESMLKRISDIRKDQPIAEREAVLHENEINQNKINQHDSIIERNQQLEEKMAEALTKITELENQLFSLERKRQLGEDNKESSPTSRFGVF